MEEVVLHYAAGSGSADGLSALLETTEKLLEPFPCRPPPLFTRWFPPAAGRPLPIRPAKPPPVISASGLTLDPPIRPAKPPPVISASGQTLAPPLSRQQGGTAPLQKPREELSREDRDSMSQTPSPASLFRSRPAPDRVLVLDSPVRRSWSVSSHRPAALRRSQPPSKHFDHMITVHKLNLRQRAKWTISQDHCDTSMEQVWRSLTRLLRSSRLPSCNANIQRDRGQICVFCDVVNSEQVGRFLKDELKLTGKIRLSVHRLGNVFSL
ncbi:shieldin complex subunit 3 [Scomber japonicus]|uniref:shieldin complex subunit 3 n=1 Tax=Scomber japonicus TaxID=13676 RepID=UPI002306BF10|nr:shieldin complex subunit 3 [Scomber japonicus]